MLCTLLTLRFLFPEITLYAGQFDAALQEGVGTSSSGPWEDCVFSACLQQDPRVVKPVVKTIHGGTIITAANASSLINEQFGRRQVDLFVVFGLAKGTAIRHAAGVRKMGTCHEFYCPAADQIKTFDARSLDAAFTSIEKIYQIHYTSIHLENRNPLLRFFTRFKLLPELPAKKFRLDIEYVVDQVLAIRKASKEKGGFEYFVSWQGYDYRYCSWVGSDIEKNCKKLINNYTCAKKALKRKSN
jgi:hypothetical protein